LHNSSTCAPVVVVQTYTSDLDLEIDAYVKTYPDLEIAYDFWSQGGVPFISFFNSTADTLLLDLTKSRLRLVGENYSESLEDAILFQSGNESLSDVYPEAVLKFTNRRMQLVLIPKEWSSIYGPSCYSPRNIQRGGVMEFTYSYSKNETIEKITHSFNSTAITRLQRKDIDSYQRTDAGPDQYFVDNQNQPDEVDLNNISMVLELIAAILFAF